MADTDFKSHYDTRGSSRQLGVLCLGAIETNTADVRAGTLWLLSAMLKKPLSYFYPPYAREIMTPEEMGELEHELLMHFIAIRGKDLQKLTIDLVKVMEKFDPLELVIDQAPIIQERLRRQEKDKSSFDKDNPTN